jgi:glucans biosynthesis protein C
LLVYTLLLAALLPLMRGRLAALGAWLGRRPGWLLLAAPIVYLAAARIVLLPLFEVTHDLVNDWYNHAVSLAAFLLGYLVMKDGRAVAAFVRLRWIALGLFVAAYALLMPYYWAYRAEDAVPPELLRMAMRLVYATDQWSAIIALLGFGAVHLNRDSALLRTLTVAVFPFYIAHQTIIVVVGHQLKALHLPVAVEAAALLVATALGCWLTWEIARRFAPLRPLFGLGPDKARASATLDPTPVPQ